MTNKSILALLLALLSLSASAADKENEGLTYYLPKTTVNVSLLVEKTTYTPGQMAAYAELYFKTPAKTVADVDYRIVGIRFSTEGVPDSTKRHTILLDKKHSIFDIDCEKNGVLRAINTKGVTKETPTAFVPARKPAPLNPNDYMSQDILSAGNLPKMAQMVAQEIYDIRDSRNQLSRGEADFMPNDGEQLRMMLVQLRTQETALMQMFTGVTVKDTTECVFQFVPDPTVQKRTLFRFSKKFGCVADDDLSGEPYYVYVDDEHIYPDFPDEAEAAKKQKDDLVLGVNLPGKIRVRLSAGSQTQASFETYAAQYGREEMLSGSLFGKKMTARLVLDTMTGAVVSLKTEPIE